MTSYTQKVTHVRLNMRDLQYTRNEKLDNSLPTWCR